MCGCMWTWGDLAFLVKILVEQFPRLPFSPFCDATCRSVVPPSHPTHSATNPSVRWTPTTPPSFLPFPPPPGFPSLSPTTASSAPRFPLLAPTTPGIHNHVFTVGSMLHIIFSSIFQQVDFYCWFRGRCAGVGGQRGQSCKAHARVVIMIVEILMSYSGARITGK